MAMQTGENEQALRKIIDFTRLLSLSILLLHFYLLCYSAFRQWGLTAPIVDRIVFRIGQLGLFQNSLATKSAALLLLVISLVGAKGRKDEHLKKQIAIGYLLMGLFHYFISGLVTWVRADATLLAALYIAMTALGYLLILTGGTLLSRLITDVTRRFVTFPS